MNQNIFGAILFCVIVGTAIFLTSVFSTVTEPLTISDHQPPTFVSERGCKKANRRKTGEIKIVQSVFNLKSKKLTTQLNWAETSEEISVPVNFHFFVLTPNGYEYLASENVFVTQDLDSNKNSTILSSFSWLDSRATYNNLYLFVEPVSKGYQAEKSGSVIFNAAKATPILVDKGKI